MRQEILAAILILLVVGSLCVGFVMGTGNQRTITTTATQIVTQAVTQTATSGSHFETPVTPTFFIGGVQQTMSMCLTLPHGSQSSLNVTATGPSGFSNYTTAMEYSFVPFPLGSAFPNWLHPSMSPPYVEMNDGGNVTANLLLAPDSSAQNGAMGSFALHANFDDPVSGTSVTDVIAIQVTVSPSSSVTTCQIAN